MRLELINPYALSILAAARREDSINAISGRISLSYGWTYKWVRELADAGVFTLTRMKVFLNEKNSFYKKTLKYVKSCFAGDAHFYYKAVSLFGIQYCFTATDSVFVWTKGGYNIGRYRGFYPIFIKVKKQHKRLFYWYCRKLGLRINAKKGVFYKVDFLEDFNFEHCDGIPVDSFGETVAFMRKYIYNFEPALEMINEIYGERIKAKYKEVLTNV